MPRAVEKAPITPARSGIFPVAMLVVLLILSVSAWRFIETIKKEKVKQRYENDVEIIVRDIVERLETYKMVLRGAGGLFSASEEVIREEWRAFYEYQQILLSYPGVRGIGFCRIIRPPELARHQKTVGADGFPDYRVHPAGDRDAYAPLVFLEPSVGENRRIIGYDVYSEPVSRIAMERARDIGDITIKSKADPGPNAAEGIQNDFLMFLPVYMRGVPLDSQEERRAAVEGYVLGLFRLNEMMQGIFRGSLNEIEFSIYEGGEISPATLLYESPVRLDGSEIRRKPMFVSQETLGLYGSLWTVVFRTTPFFEAAVDRYTAKGIFALFLLISLLVFLNLRIHKTAGDRALHLARKMSAAYRISEKKYRFLTENSLDVIWTVDLEGRVTYISPAIENMLGYTSKEIMGMPMSDYIVREDYDALMERLAEELAILPAERARTATLRARYKTRDNRLVHVEIKAWWILDGQGKIIGVQGSTRDITERKQLEELIIKNKRMYQSIVDTQHEMIARYLPDTTLTFVNDAYCRIFGKPRHELLGRRYLDFIQPELHNKEIEQIGRLSPSEPGSTEEYCVILPGGKTLWVEWTDRGIFNEAGELTEIQGVGHDVTRRKKAEEEARINLGRAESLLQAASLLNADLDLETVVQTVCEGILSLNNASGAAVLFHDEKSRAFRLVGSRGLPPDFTESLGSLSREIFDEIMRTFGADGVIPDPAFVPDPALADLFRKHGVHQCAYAVMHRDESLIGVLAAFAIADKGVFPGGDIQILKGLADQAISAVKNARLFAKEKEHLSQMRALHNIDMAIAASHDLRVVFNVVLYEAMRVLPADAAAIMRFDPHTGKLTYRPQAGFRSGDLENIVLTSGEGYAGRVVLERRPLHISDLRQAEPDSAQGAFIIEEGFSGYRAVPIILKGSVWGVLETFHRAPLKAEPDGMTFLEMLASQAAIAIDNGELFHGLEKSKLDLLRAYDATIEGWAFALDLKDEETKGHSSRVTEMTLRIAGEMGMKDDELSHVRRGALLHDIGKMGIPDTILNKPGKLTDDERDVMRGHPVHAYEMLSSIEYLRPAMDIPYCHHEKWDGSGYPRGLKGKQIPLAARVFAVVDVFDALTNDRPYRRAWSKRDALDLIQRESGKHFDPLVVETFLKVLMDLAGCPGS